MKYLIDMSDDWKGEDNCTNCIINTNDCFNKGRCPLSNAKEAVEALPSLVSESWYEDDAWFKEEDKPFLLYAVKATTPLE